MTNYFYVGVYCESLKNIFAFVRSWRIFLKVLRHIVVIVAFRFSNDGDDACLQ